ncbi:MAG: beta-N-acetylhexosaminidase [bacterium]
MTLGPLMLDLEGCALDDDEIRLIASPMVGGIIFFARNFESAEQISRLVSDIRDVRPELLICVDQEGGRVQRFKEGFTRLPPMQVLGDLFDESDDDAAAITRDTGWLMASELIACGLDFSFAPVLDVDRSTCEVIANRSFGDSPERVIKAAGQFIAGMAEAGMAATGKHFPGHGGVTVDSHLATPYDQRDLAAIQARDMRPFKTLAAELRGIMPAHMVLPNIDDHSVGFSRYWLQEVLRGELNFQGVIFSDDLSMKGADVVGGYTDKARAALEAGCDMILVCNNREGALKVLQFLEQAQEENPQLLNALSADRLAGMRRSSECDWSALNNNPRWRNTREKLADLTGS